MIDAAEIRFRAERRIGELMAAQRATVGLADGGDAARARVRNRPELDTRPTLTEAGIDKHLADRARKLAEVRIGEVLGPATRDHSRAAGAKSHACDIGDLAKDDRVRFRKLAEHGAEVRQRIESATDADAVSRRTAPSAFSRALRRRRREARP